MECGRRSALPTAASNGSYSFTELRRSCHVHMHTATLGLALPNAGAPVRAAYSGDAGYKPSSGT